MAITLELYELKNICKDMAELGAANFYKKMAPGKDLISQREAYSEYGEARVKGWVKMELVSKQRIGSARNSKLLYSRAELISAEKIDELNYYINK